MHYVNARTLVFPDLSREGFEKRFDDYKGYFRTLIEITTGNISCSDSWAFLMLKEEASGI